MNIYEYSRLSRYDGDNLVSDSIINQNALIDDFVNKNPEFIGAKIVKLSDDDYTGMNLKRPSMQELLTAVRTRKADVVIVKDFSRISREHLDLCTLIDKIFPFMGVRFISVFDNYDSEKRNGEPLELAVAFKAILNEFYIIETSEKITRVFDMKIKKGEFLSGSLPFGYRFAEKHKPEIIPEKAEIIGKIFKLRLQGKRIVDIVVYLNKNEILYPSVQGNGLWDRNKIRKILTERAYIGEKIYRRKKRDLTTKKAIFQPENEWTVIPDLFPPIIDRDIFGKVQETMRKSEKPCVNVNKKTIIYKKIHCAKCKNTLMRRGESFLCKNRDLHGGERCFEGEISTNDLYPKILEKVKLLIGAYLETHKPRRTISEKAKLVQKIKHLNTRFRELFDRCADEIITEQQYFDEKTKLNLEIEKVQNALDELGSEQAMSEKPFGSESPIEKLRRIYNSENLTRESMEFVKKIVVYDKDHFDIVMDERDLLTVLCTGNSIYIEDRFSGNI